MVDGVRYAKGIGMHAPLAGAPALTSCWFYDSAQPSPSGRGRAAWNLAGRFNRFFATIALARQGDNEPYGGSVTFRVYVDGVLRYESPTVVAQTLPLALSIDTAGAQTIVLETDSLDGHLSGHAVRLNARLRRTCP